MHRWFWKKARQAYTEHRWGSLILYIILATITLLASFLGLDRLATLANQKLDEGAPDMMPYVTRIFAWDWFPVVAMLVMLDLAVIGFLILYKRAGQPTAHKEDPQPFGVEMQPISSGKRKETGVAAQMVAKTIHDHLDFTQQVVEALQPKELTESEEWWEQYRPSCEIVKVDILKITKGPNVYHFELPIDVKYTSRDSRYSTGMDCTTILLDVFHTGKDREKTPYRLHSSGLPLRIDEKSIKEGRYKVELQQKWDLPSNESRIIRYTFEGQTEGEPLVENETSCIISHIGIPLIHNVNINKPLKIADSKFPIAVDDGFFVVKIDKQY